MTVCNSKKLPENVQSWGRYPKHFPAMILRPDWLSDITFPNEVAVLGFGLGRSYGDSCQNSNGTIIDCSRLNRMLGFDETTGILRCESGVSLGDILHEFTPRGWFLPVTPGTKFVTVGGAVANDVHGKNHHCEGTFGRHILRFGLLRSNGESLECSPESNADLFRATIGGMGLTGIITWAEVQLKRIETPFIAKESRRFASLDEFFDISTEFDTRFSYTVSWTDCVSPLKFGRGILMAGNHAVVSDSLPEVPHARTKIFPFDMPSWALNRYSILAFNASYYRSHFSQLRRSIEYYDSFFYPLDAILHWNRMYGRRGFLQYQFHAPFSAGKEVVSDIFRRIARSGEGSFLAVLKTFGSIKSPGLMSFPREGVNLALDFPFRGKSTLKLLDILDDAVADAGGAVYPAKDARMSARAFKRFFPQWNEFAQFIDQKFSSDFWRRVSGD